MVNIPTHTQSRRSGLHSGGRVGEGVRGGDVKGSYLYCKLSRINVQNGL